MVIAGLRSFVEDGDGRPAGFDTEFGAFGPARRPPWREPIDQVLAELHAADEIGDIIDRRIDGRRPRLRCARSG